MPAERFMRMALKLARRGEGATSPNPMVGAVVVKNGRVVGKGYHRRAGGPHAEVLALRDAGPAARGADMYVTLEPCNHWGRTPPCTIAIAEAGVGRVFAGMRDPNPMVDGGGFRRLADRNIEFHVGVLEEECRRLNAPFIKHITTRKPYVVLKSAMTLDGVIATRTGDSRWITGDVARKHAHRLRSVCDAVVVGIGTVRRDDPSLTVRLVRPKSGQPLRVILDSRLRIPLGSRVLTDVAARTLVATTSAAPASRRRKLEKLPGVEVMVCRSRNGSVSLRDAMSRLGKRGVQSVLIEGGAKIHASALADGVVDRVAFYYAPKIAGGASSIHAVGGNGFRRISQGWDLTGVTTRRLGRDLLVEGYIGGAP